MRGKKDNGDRLPPHSPEAERGVLGCLLLEAPDSAAGLARALERIQGEPVFYELRHATIFAALAELHAEGKPADTILLRQRLADQGRLDQIGGDEYLGSLADGVPSALMLDRYLEVVWEKYLARLLLQNAVQTASDIQEHNGATEALLARVKRLQEEWEKKSERGTITPRYLRRPGEFSDEIMARLFGLAGQEMPGLELPIKFPLKIRHRETTLVSGDDGAGKSTLLSYLLLHLAGQGEKICVASMEMPKDVTMWVLASQLLGTRRLPDMESGYQLGKEALLFLDRHFVVYDFLGIADWREILDTFRYAAEHLGVKQFLIDSVMRIGIADDDYAQQGFCAAAFANFAMRQDAHLFYVIHENKGDGKGKAKVRGSKLWSANACNVLSVERNMKKGDAVSRLEWDLHQERAQEQPDAEAIRGLEEKIRKSREDWDSHLVLQKQRWPGSQQNGSKRFWYDPGSFQFRGHWQDQAVNWLERWGKRGKREEGKT